MDKKEFIRGILEPDFVSDKDRSHYSEKDRGVTLQQHLKTKVNLKKYLEENEIDSDYQRGVFLHLYTDYEFFNHFFDDDFLENKSYDDFCKDLYYSYRLTNQVLDEKYPVDIGKYKEKIEKNIQKDLKEKNCEEKKYTNILPAEKLIFWIERIGSVNLDFEKEKWVQ